MLAYPQIDPVAIYLGPLKIHWYGLMYVLGFLGAWLLGSWRVRKPGCLWTSEQVGDMICYAAFGGILGGRVGYMLFYNLSTLLADPLSLFRVWEGGMSIHGGLIGALFSLYLCKRRIKKPFFELVDFAALLLPFGLGVGRIGNFINGELWGRVTDVPWAMVFPHAGELPRHPSQLYESVLEGFVLFIILWVFAHKPKPRMAISGLFLSAYGLIRVLIEFFRTPDPQLGYLAFNWLTMGQVLSLPMMLIGIFMMIYAYVSSQPRTVI